VEFERICYFIDADADADANERWCTNDLIYMRPLCTRQ